jgi:hypothetical protein
MKVKEFIKILNNIDPSGDKELLCNGNDIQFVSHSEPGYTVSCSRNVSTGKLDISNQKEFINIVNFNTYEIIKDYNPSKISLDISNNVQSHDFIKYISDISGYTFEDCKRMVTRKPKNIIKQELPPSFGETTKTASISDMVFTKLKSKIDNPLPVAQEDKNFDYYVTINKNA